MLLSHVEYSRLSQHETDALHSSHDEIVSDSEPPPLRHRSPALTPNHQQPQQPQHSAAPHHLLIQPTRYNVRSQSDPTPPHDALNRSKEPASSILTTLTSSLPLPFHDPPLPVTSPLSAPAASRRSASPSASAMLLASAPNTYFRRHSSPSSHLEPSSSTRSLLSDGYGRTIFFCLLFVFLFFVIFTIEYVYIDRTYHRDAIARLELQSNTLASTMDQLNTKANELQAAQEEILDKEQRVQDLHQQLSQRDEALLMYRQLVTDLQERTTQTETEQAARLLQAQMQASELINKTSFLFGPQQATVETVTRVTEGKGAQTNSSGGAVAHSADAEMVATKLVDSENNEYILSSPSDSSLKSVDSRLILDLGIVIISAAIGGLLSSFLHQPPLLGYLLAGSAIGPGGLRLIGQFVQVETLAEFGATFLLFALGVEFSFAKLSRVRNVAVGSGTLMMVLLVCVVAAIGYLAVGVAWGKGLFVGAVLSMSSTTVVVKSLMERKQLTSRVGQVMLGLLIVQDIFLSLLLSIISLASSPAEELAHDIGVHLLKFAALAVIVVCCAFLWPLALRMLDYSRSHDLFLLGLVALCVTLTVVADRVIGSAEVGAFLAGILVSSSPTASPELTKRSLRLFEPIRDMFGALFFSSMGMLINPAFLLHNWAEVIALVLVTVALKSLIGTLCARLWGQSTRDALHIALCLSQIGEFAFVLASQGLRAGLLVRDDYMLLLGVTAVSIFCTPGLIAGSFWLRRALAAEGEVDEVEGGATGGIGGGDGAGEREAVRKDSGWMTDATDDGRDSRNRLRKEKRSDGEFLFSQHPTTSSSSAERGHLVPSASLAYSRHQQPQHHQQDHENVADDDVDADGFVPPGGRRVLTATYPLKRGHSALAAAEVKDDGQSGGPGVAGDQRGSNWKDRRRQRQAERARQLSVERRRELEEKEEQVRIRMGDERKDWRDDDSQHR